MGWNYFRNDDSAKGGLVCPDCNHPTRRPGLCARCRDIERTGRTHEYSDLLNFREDRKNRDTYYDEIYENWREGNRRKRK
jgi:hypothetical protein